MQYPDAWYHVMNRGRRGEDVFTGKKDYNAFIDLLKELVEDYKRIGNRQIMLYERSF